MKSALIELSKNLKIEITIVFIAIICYFVKKYALINVQIAINLSQYFSQDRLNSIAAFFAITIGVYIAVITVLATAEIGISKELLRRRLDKPLINVMIAGMAENFISVGLAIFIPLNFLTQYILGVSLVVSAVSFVKFIMLLVIIFKNNMEQMAKEIDNEDYYRNAMITYMEGIFKHCQKQEKKDK